MISSTLMNSYEAIAWAIAKEAHKGQVYKRSNMNWEYITHIKRVVHMLEDASWKVKIVAILHDVVEDSDILCWEIGDIFDEEIAIAVHAISRVKKTESYTHYITRCGKNRIARKVKSADLADHIVNCIRPDAPDNWKSMLDRYTEAMRILHRFS